MSDLEAIRERHRPAVGTRWCECGDLLPCDTAQVIAALDGLTGPDVERLARALMVAANNGDRPITDTAYATAIRVLEALASESEP